MASRKNPFLDTATTLGKLIGFLGVSVVCGLLMAGLLVPAVAVTGASASAGVDAFNNLPSDFPDDLKDVDPSQSTKILASDGSLIATIYDINRTPVPTDQISKYMGEAVVSVEDSRYYEHGGVDPTGLARALFASLSGSRQGASTITQQYVNNLLIQKLMANGQRDEVKLGDAKGIGDKVKEMRMAIALEQKYSKADILTGYLNIVNFANGNFGVQAAAKYYYNKDAKDLTLAESAMLAGVVNSPSYYDPVTHPDNAKQRRDTVLQLMLTQKKISQQEYNDAIAQPVKVQQNRVPNGCQAAAQAEYFCSYVSNVLKNENNLLPDFKDRDQMLLQSGLTVKTTLDPRLQGPMQKQVDTMVPPSNNPDKIGHAMVTVEPGTGNVLAMAQNTSIVAAAGQWSNVYNFNVDATDASGKKLGGAGGFQPGSTMKPFTFAEWLNEGHAVNEQVDGTVRRYPPNFQWKNTCGSTTGVYDSREAGSSDLNNAEEGFYIRNTALYGLQQSLNTFTFAEAAKLDFCGIQKTMTAAGIHQGSDGKSPYDVSQASSLIGTQNIAPMTMATAFATFASGGTRCDPKAIVSITDPTGKSLPIPETSCTKNAINSDVAAGTMTGLQSVLNGGSGYLIPLKVPAGAKTGTTNKSEHTWTVGVTKGLSTASWVGIPDSFTSINNKVIAGAANQNYGTGTFSPDGRVGYVDGSGPAGHSWQAYMNQTAGYYDTSGFPKPPEKMLNGERRNQPSQDSNKNNGNNPPNGQPSSQPSAPQGPPNSPPASSGPRTNGDAPNPDKKG